MDNGKTGVFWVGVADRQQLLPSDAWWWDWDDPGVGARVGEGGVVQEQFGGGHEWWVDMGDAGAVLEFQVGNDSAGEACGWW